jgi:peptide/nickel transport system ATP-binding protein
MSAASLSPPVLEARSLCRFFSVGTSFWGARETLRAVDDVSLVLRPGKVSALVGESGSGKSTVARLLSRLYEPTAGSILLEDEDVTRIQGRRRLREYRAQVQLIFQDPFASLNPVKKVGHHITRPLRIHHVVPDREVRTRMLELLDTVGLVPAAAVAEKYPHELSGGQRQRVAIARALAVEPKVVLADEPISMLDVSIRLGILNLVRELKERRHIAFLYITHDLASARYVSDEIHVMYRGRIVEHGPTEAVLQSPLHAYTKLLLSAVPRPEAGLAAGSWKGRTGETAELAAHGWDPDVPTALVEERPGHFVRREAAAR